MKGDKTMNITVTGTVDEIIAFAELLKAGKKAQEPSKPIDVAVSYTHLPPVSVGNCLVF